MQILLKRSLHFVASEQAAVALSGLPTDLLILVQLSRRTAIPIDPSNDFEMHRRVESTFQNVTGPLIQLPRCLALIESDSDEL